MLAEWIRSVLICAILFSVILYIAPNPQMRGYVRTAVGFVMIIVVLSPLLSLLSYEDRLTFDLYSEVIGTGLTDGENDLYADAIEVIVQDYIYDSYGISAQVDITLSEDSVIKGMSVTIDYSRTPSEVLYDSMRSGLSERYDIDEGLIIIM